MMQQYCRKMKHYFALFIITAYSQIPNIWIQHPYNMSNRWNCSNSKLPEPEIFKLVSNSSFVIKNCKNIPNHRLQLSYVVVTNHTCIFADESFMPWWWFLASIQPRCPNSSKIFWIRAGIRGLIRQRCSLWHNISLSLPTESRVYWIDQFM